jgi:isopenicillin N synthase-like dioxygenase
MSLPIISLAPYLSSSDTIDSQPTRLQLEVSSKIHEAILSKGFFYLTDHGISDSEMKMALSLARQFFELDVSEKMKLAVGNNTGRGARG